MEGIHDKYVASLWIWALSLEAIFDCSILKIVLFYQSESGDPWSPAYRYLQRVTGTSALHHSSVQDHNLNNNIGGSGSGSGVIISDHRRQSEIGDNLRHL